GALHQGHLSLVDASRQENPVTVVSIFVNPTQFNDPKDFEKYPKTIERDIELLESAGTDVLFLPSVEEMYPEGTGRLRHYALDYLETILDGKYRPGHFQGVCNVMERLMNIVEPDNLYMGRKDYQQCMVVKRLLALMGSPARLHPCPTLREADGLAMSSRNMRLGPADRQKATAIFQVLSYLKENLRPGPLAALRSAAVQRLTERGFKVDYIEIADADTLELLNEWDGKRNVLALAAAFLGEVRLIDNMGL
ncbi:MAG: pantoate--beta-alanine ligase, partial [Bacteroidetes bacterium]|nr:pantoate--beta-alanine ligase [Bacteroidota bacterium]